MEPVTHILMGAVLSRAGLNRKAAYMTAAMTIAAEFPDIDMVWGWGGPVAGFEHHRGITHTFVGLPVEAAVVTGLFYAYHRFRKTETAAPLSWAWLYGGAMLALLSHLLLDWTNNYGLRPFFPFNPRWYAGSFVFIVEPVLLLILALALLGPALFGLINSEVGAGRAKFKGRGSAIVALLAVAALYCLRYVEHAKALEAATQAAPPDMLRVFASPHPTNPFTWHIVTETPASYQLSTMDSRSGAVEPSSPSDTIYKPAPTLPILAAKRSPLGEVYLDWSMYPVLTETPDNRDPNHPLVEIRFSDARFYYDVGPLHGKPDGGGKPPLSGTVLLDMAAPDAQRVVETKMDDLVQK